MSKDARQGRGAGNGGNSNWYNSPLWENIKSPQKTVDAYESVCEDSQHQVTQDEDFQNRVNDDELDWKLKARKLQRAVY